ncbi:MAG: DUF1579 family protein [Gammaproteobacteria bacterium]|nr:DUF1579 family protein [Gammaproteobacteria bacterium]
MDMPQPGPLHERLASLNGSWHGEETMYPSPWDPAGGVAQAQLVNREALAGFAILQDYEQKRGGKTSFTGHGVFWVDPDSGEVVLHWFDSMGFAPNVFRGGFEGGALVLHYASPMGKQRVRFEWPEPLRYRFRMDMSQDGESWMPLMAGEYRRV